MKYKQDIQRQRGLWAESLARHGKETGGARWKRGNVYVAENRF